MFPLQNLARKELNLIDDNNNAIPKITDNALNDSI